MTPREVMAALGKAPAKLALALTLWGEGRGESREGRLAIAWVIFNRSVNRRQTIQAVCFDPWDFSCWPVRPTLDVNQIEVIAHAERLLAGDALADHPILQECLVIAQAVLTGATTDTTQGSDHYMTIDRYHQALAHPDTDPARWCLEMARTVTAGHHIFFRSHEGARA